MKPLTALCSFAVALLLATAVRGDTPEQTFKQMYGPRVAAASSPAKKVELARQLMKDAGDLTDDKAFQAELYDQAYKLAMSTPEGYPVAVESMEALVQAQPDAADAAGEKMTAVLEKQYRSGPPAARRSAAEKYLEKVEEQAAGKEQQAEYDAAIALYQKATPAAELLGRERVSELLARTRAARARKLARKTALDLEAKLKEHPDDTRSTVELVRLLTMQLDEPAQASRFLRDTKDATLQREVANAAKAPEDLSETEALDLANWYRGQVARGDELSKPIALARAKTYYELFLKAHEKEDAERLTARRSLADVQKSLDAMGGGKHSINLLEMLDPKRDALAGKWQFRDGVLVSDASESMQLLRFPYLPPAEYDYRLAFSTKGHVAITLILTDKAHAVCFTVGGWDGTNAGFEMVNGADCRTNPTKLKLPSFLAPGKYVLEIRVRSAEVSAYLDGKMITRWATDGSDLTAPSGFTAGGCLGVATSRSSAPCEYYSAEVVEVNGSGKPFRAK